MKSFGLAELAQASGFSVDTIRYYQGLGLVERPRRVGRRAVYSESHLKRLRLVRSMSERGLSLKVIKDLVRSAPKSGVGRTLLAAVEEKTDDARHTREDFAKLCGIPEGLLDLVEASSLSEVLHRENGTILYSDADVEATRGALRILEYGLPVTRLLGLALKHHAAMSEAVDEMIDLFNVHVRQKHGDAEAAEAFREMLPTVVLLLAHHFYRLLVGRALERIGRSGDEEVLRLARETASRVRFRLPLQ